MKNKLKILLFSFFIFPLCVKANTINVNNYEQLKEAIQNNATEINIESDITYDSLITISNDIIIKGNNHKLNRDLNYSLGLFSISNTGRVTINDLTIDGGAPNWQMDIANGVANSSGYFRVDMINGENDIVATQPLILNSGELNIKKSTFQNIRNNNGNSTSSGGAIRSTSGTLTIEDTTFKHCASYREGGALYITGGDATINNSNFTDNTAGANYKGQTHGGAIQINGANNVIIDNSTFKDNFAQHNGGAIMLQVNGSNIKITNSNFKHNSAGNDGAALSLESRNTKHKIEITDTIFDDNQGLATASQSMGTIWLDSWKNDDTIPAEFKNIKFINNHTAHGSAFASYGTNSPYCILDNIESYNNKANGVGNFFFQSGTYLLNNANIHDNSSGNGGGIVTVGGDAIVTNSKIKNNIATQRGGGAMAAFGTLTIKDSQVTNNHANTYGGGLSAYSMYASYGTPNLKLENVIVKDNSADISGGGLAIQDTGNSHSIINIDNASKIYDNSATTAADDILYTQANSTAGANITLDNISIANLLGIDGWYFDEENDRFKDTDNPTVFEDIIENDGSIAFYLKAAGIFEADYDGNGGTTKALPVKIKYGNTYIVDDDIPIREGYTFEGWNTKANGSGTSLKAGDEYDGKDGMLLYAIWSPKGQLINPETGSNLIKIILILITVIALAVITIKNKPKYLIR